MSVGRVASITDTGRKRRRNEDAFVVRPPLFAVADGMGGARAGELASRLAAEALREHDDGSTEEERVAALVQEANRRVYRRSHEDVEASGMGTTITAALVADDAVVVGHVGDSRAYRIRANRLEQLTQDHNFVQELVRDGKLSPEEAVTHPQRSVITRAVGTDPDVDVDVGRFDARPGDVFLLCSDGLTDMVSDEDILATVERHRHDLDSAARELVSHANRRGGEDNITVVCFEIADASSVEQTAELTSPLPAPVDDEDDEDTLTELDAIPVLDAPPAPERREGGRGRLVLVGLLLLVLVAAAVSVLAAWELLS